MVLAAGRGRRLNPLTNTRPKPMVPVANRPLLEHVVEACRDAGVDDLVFVVGYRRDRIQTYFGDGDDWGVDVEYVVQEKQLGTGHALKQASPELEDERFLVLNGDSIVSPDLVERMSEVADKEDVVAVSRSDRPTDYGVVEVEDGYLKSIKEKPLETRSETVNAGVYGFGRGILDLLPETPDEHGEMNLTAAVSELLDEGEVRAVSAESWTDVSHLWDVVEVNAEALETAEKDVETEPCVYVGESTALGDGVSLAPNSTVLSGTSLDDNVSVGAGAVVANSVVMKDAVIEEGAVVRDSIVGEGVSVGVNSTLEGGEATVEVEDRLHRGVTFGGCVGDYTELSGGVTVAPGTVIGEDCRVASGCMVTGRVPDGARVEKG